MSAVSLRLPNEISERLEHLSKETGRTKTFYMIQAIKEHLDDLEGLYLAAAEEQGVAMDYETARTYVYGMPYSEWKEQFQLKATAEQMALFESKKAAKVQT